MDWQLKGTIIIACSCDWGCPCNFNAMPTRGKCEGGWIWAIEQGDLGNVSVDGLSVALFADWPGAIHQGGGRAACFLDDRADDTQQEALSRMLHGKIGGPWGIFINTYVLTGPRPVPFTVQLADYDSRVTIGDNVQLVLKKIRNPVTGAPAHPEMILPEGLVVKRSRLAASHVFRVSNGISYDHSGQYAAFGRFEYSGS